MIKIYSCHFMAIKFSQCYQMATKNYDDQKTGGDQKAFDCHAVVVTKNLSIATILLPFPPTPCPPFFFPSLLSSLDGNQKPFSHHLV
jgi:hypothetical protein